MERLKDFMADKHNRDQAWRTRNFAHARCLQPAKLDALCSSINGHSPGLLLLRCGERWSAPRCRRRWRGTPSWGSGKRTCACTTRTRAHPHQHPSRLCTASLSTPRQMRELSLHDDYLLYKHVEDGANTKATRSPGKQVHFSKVRYVLAVAHEVVKEVNARTGETKIVGRKPSSRWKIQMLDRKEADYEFIADTVEGRDAWVDGTRQNLHTYRRRRGLDDLLASPKYHMDEVAEKFSVTNLADPADVLPMTTLDKVEEE